MQKTVQITLYTKSPCGLCDELKADLDTLRGEAAFHATPLEIAEIDITADPELWARFQYLIPVIELPNQDLHYPPHDYVQLYNLLTAAAKNNAAPTVP